MRFLSLIAMTVLLAAAPAVWAQGKKQAGEPNRSVQGVVTDSAETPLEGAVVKLKNTKTLQIRSFMTQPNGSYYFHGLSPDVDYELQAEFQGASSGTKTLTSFDSRKEATVNLKVNSKK
jgi:hypothetical protein